MPDDPARLTCHLDVMCYDSTSVNTLARDATGQMNFVEGGFGFVCSGTILNTFDAETSVPYFLTAHHCLSTEAVVNTLEIVYFWQRNSCGGNIPNYFTLPRSNGGRLLATNPTDTGNDMTFIRLDGDLPGGAALAGFDTGGLPNNPIGVHHPNGDWKRVTFYTNTRTVNACTSTPTSQYHYLQIDTGIIEGGSSGSGLFDDGARIRGQLLGSCPGTNTTLGCNNRNEHNAVYGRFNVTYPLIQRWLEIGGTINVNRGFVGAELGTPTQPYRSVNAANNLINQQEWSGARIRIRAGNYPEAITLSRRMTILADAGAVVIGQ
jgi:hypothetical protein